jgi:hypothetical protein
MAWEYLETDALDGRFREVAARVDVAGKTLLDVNAGSCRVLRHIPWTFDRYIANDVRPLGLPLSDRAEFHLVSDAAVPAIVAARLVDVLLCFGHGAGHKLPCPLESPTLTDTIQRLVIEHRPAVVVLEGAAAYNERYHMLEELVAFCAGQGMRIEVSLEILPRLENPFARRHLRIMAL